MTMIPESGWPDVFSRLANLRRAAPANQLRSIGGSSTGVPEGPALVDVHYPESLDAVAGSEFVDDRIRVRE